MARSISRRILFRTAGAAAVGSAAGYIISRTLSGIPRPQNIVLIVSDAFRADRLSALRNGKSITPHLDALASRALRFENCYAPSSWTKTSMASILTGTYPPYNGVLMRDDTVPPACDTIGDLLQRSGWSTHAVQTNPWLSPEAPRPEHHGRPVREFGFHKGFDRYLFLDPAQSQSSLDMPAYADAAEVNSSLAYILRREKPPFFIYMHYMETHQPWMGAEPHESTGLHCSRPDGRSNAAIFRDDEKLIRKIFSVPENEVSPAEKIRLREIYDESVSYVDSRVKEAVQFLAAHVDLGETLVIFTSDHGDELYEHGALGHAHTVYEEVARVPLLILGPGIRPARISGRVSNVNLYETVKALVSPADSAREPVCRPLVTRETLKGRIGDEPIFVQLQNPDPRMDCKLTKLITTDLREVIVKENNAGDRLAVEHYDLTADPAEKTPLSPAADDPLEARLRRFERDYAALAAKHGVQHTKTESAWQRLFGSESLPDSELTEEERRLRKQLRALGYLN